MKQRGTEQDFEAVSKPRAFVTRLFAGKRRTPLRTVPVRGELLGAEHLAERARQVAAAQSIADTRARGQRRAPLLDGLRRTRAGLAAAQERVAAAVESGVDVGPAGEWLLDNNHVIQQHLRQVREGLPPGYYGELPVLTSGPLAGHPRVHELASTLIAHTEARVNSESLGVVVQAFQSVAPLRIGELWALPAMLGLALLDSVERTARRSVDRLDELAEAHRRAARIEAAARGHASALNAALSDFMNAPPVLSPEFVSVFLRRLRPLRGAHPPLVWLEHWIAEEAMSAEAAATRAGQRLAVSQVIMSNSVTSLRTIAMMNWPAFVERHSRMEQVLRDDPSGFHPRMAFETRDDYRHVVERLARRTGRDEADVARIAVGCAQAAESSNGGEHYDPRVAHVGYYLVDAGRAQLEAAIGFRRTVRERIRRWVRRHPDIVLIGGIVAATAATLAGGLALAGGDARAAWSLVLLFMLLPAAEIAVSVLNRLMAEALPPDRLPSLDFRGPSGVPEEYRTAVVIPTLFESTEGVLDALENLEAQFLANREAHLHFALLSDYTDAAAETCPGDAAILAAAAEGVRELNARYGTGGEDSFFLFHRPRRWNEGERKWMGWERKRGKLGDFNRFIRGSGEGVYSLIVGDTEPLLGVRYVITLDADTVLPPDAAPRLVGTMAHPLNRAVYDPQTRRVVRGYGILQPRVGVSLPSAHRSRFAAIFSGHPGVDPYSTASSDVYQDLYREGSFTGKGIYDVDVFERATRGRFPENTLLSHDLIEGSYARAGLATDINVYDDYPARYLTWAQRKHRWIRGDWQLVGWLWPRVQGVSGRYRNRLSVLSRWKIFDNLRRSTVELAQLAFLVAGWTLLPGSPLRWTLLGLGAIATPWLVVLLLAVLQPPLDRSWRAYYGAVARDAGTAAQQILLAFTFLLHQALVSADAIVRTLWRMFVSRRDLLAWRTASATERTHSRSGLEGWREMRLSVALALGILALAGTAAGLRGDFGAGSPRALPLAFATLPLISLWLAAPIIAHRLNAPVLAPRHRLGAESRLEAMRYALLHWRYFDRFVGPQTHGLAPDNYQEEPSGVVAMRTSPTNMGLQLLATVSACDLGFLTPTAMVERLESALTTMAGLARFRGHFFNWYDLRDLGVLAPAYISTVDSGNLAGHLLAVRQACLARAAEPEAGADAWASLTAALGLADDALARLLAEPAAHQAPLAPEALDAVMRSRAQLAQARAGLAAGQRGAGALAALQESLGRAREGLASTALPALAAEGGSEWLLWSEQRIRAELEGGPDPDLAERLRRIADTAHRLAIEMEFGFLYDPARKLFAIGYDAGAHTLDPSYYDLLASEARLASFIAVAKNDVPVEHWFRLGRSLTHASGATALVSWSGSMFEYLMPTLVMRTFPATLLDQTYRGAVRRQMAHGAARGVPWGVSESAYNLRDREFTYQYRAFGVPNLGLQRGLGSDLVVAPYASALALAVEPQAALANLAALARIGGLGPYGFRDALDYTRPDPGQKCAVIGSYMAHHIGMSLVALTNLLTADLWQRRFHADPLVRATELLLYERIPRRLVLQEARLARPEEGRPDTAQEALAVRAFESPDTARPHIALLGYLPYTVMVSHCGSGSSSYEGLAVTRWTRDGTTDHTGQFCYVKDLTAQRVWSAAHQPTCQPADRYRVELTSDHVNFQRTDGTIRTRMEIAVVPEDAAEIRRVTVTNDGPDVRLLELTSYGEIVLGDRDEDAAHPAFSKLFVETEWHEWCHAVTATRRPRSAAEPRLWCVHVVATGKERVGAVTYETDRGRFLGRGRTPRDPLAMETDGSLDGSTGAVLDPIFSLRTRVRLAPGQRATVAFTTLVAPSRERAFELADRYRHLHEARRALDLAWTSTQVELRDLKVSSADAAVFQDLAGQVLYPDANLRPPQAELARSRGPQPLLWQTGISGDLPILLASIDSTEGLPTLRQLFAAHHFWRRHGLKIDLVVLNGRSASYFQELNDGILAALSAASGSGMTDVSGGVYVRRRELLVAETLRMLEGTAAVHLVCDGNALARIVAPAARSAGATLLPAAAHPARAGAAAAQARVATPAPPPVEALAADNGYGGLDRTGDYIVRVAGDALPPAPWSNVVANPQGGFLTTERGAGFTWAGSSYAYRLTPWHNDPVSDVPGEVIYLRDEESGRTWSPTAAAMRSDEPYRVRHGPGSSTFEHERDGIASSLTIAMAVDAAVKLSLLRLSNLSGRPRRIALTSYTEWVLGTLRKRTRHHVHTALDAGRSAGFAQNRFDPQYSEWMAFSALSEPLTEHTCDRREFLGRNGSVANPLGLHRILGGASGAALDPCAVLRCTFELAPGETRDIVHLLGAAPDEAAARAAVDGYRDPARAAAAIAAATAHWEERLSVITVRTPDPTFDVMVNRWSLYQALSCRMWGRAALYQNSGAYGFRDQLQDVMAFVHAAPEIAREHILRAAARQFREGDVQHWWHPQSGRGVRTRFSDDLAWLPFVVAHYARVTGDAGVLDEPVAFLHMRSLGADEHEAYDLPQVSAETAPVYDHCVRALERACTEGSHGLPLMGTGDWNDGMNRVGAAGRGESVWLAWFLISTLRSFAGLAEARGDAAFSLWCRAQADRYAAAVEAHGWDGEWYRRAYFDDGQPLGTAGDAECRIDSIAQSWSVLSGAGDPARQRIAMHALERELVLAPEQIVRLLTPPFDDGPRDPGYIRSYVPGVRENGAQYTHAALWAAQATARLGDGGRAFELFQMLNPLSHTRTRQDVERYRVEPYAIAADVYTSPQLLGRGGWTWYTGSASWFYRVALEEILGFDRTGARLSLRPRVPLTWPEFTVTYRFGAATYTIRVLEPGTLHERNTQIAIDGRVSEERFITLSDDGAAHEVVVSPS